MSDVRWTKCDVRFEHAEGDSNHKSSIENRKSPGPQSPRSNDLKVLHVAGGLFRPGFGGHYLVHAGSTRPFLQARQQCCLFGLIRHGQYLNGGIFVVLDPAAHADGAGLALHEPAEADALHSSSHDVSLSLHQDMFDPTLTR